MSNVIFKLTWTVLFSTLSALICSQTNIRPKLYSNAHHAFCAFNRNLIWSGVD